MKHGMVSAAGFLAVFYSATAIYSSSPDSTTIAVSLLTLKHEFYQYLESGLRTEALAHSFSISIEAGEYDLAQQQKQIQSFIAKKVDAIVITPCDSWGIGSSIVEANRAHIPVFTVDIANISAKGSVVAHIASDNVDGGRKAATLMEEALGDSGTVVIINHPNVTSVMDRVAGFREGLRDHPRIRILAEIPSWGLRDRAMSITEDILLKLPDVNGVFAINDNSALGVLDAVNAAGKKVSIIGYDAIPEVRKAIDQGKISGAIIQYPEKIGAITVETVARYLAGEKVPSTIKVPVGIRTRNSK